MITYHELMGLFKKRWLQWNLKRSYAGDPQAMARLYRLQDPWDLNVPIEHFRFQETTRIISECIGEKFDSILEIGCGEGLQTQYLSPLTKRIVGIDLSRHAIKRARERRIQNATFDTGDLSNYQRQGDNSFDLVTACEMMYYTSDLEKTYASLNRLGNACVATYCRRKYLLLDQFFSTKSVHVHTIRGPSSEWRLVWWRNKRS